MDHELTADSYFMAYFALSVPGHAQTTQNIRWPGCDDVSKSPLTGVNVQGLPL